MSSLLDSITTVAIGDIEPHPENPRRGDVDAIAESLRELEQYVPIVVQRSTGFIIKGNHTWMAAQQEGWPTIDVVYVEVDDERARKIMLADNRSSELGYYDNDALAALLASLADSDDLVGTLYSTADVDVLLATVGSHRDGDELGGVRPGQTPADRASTYDASTIRSIILPLGGADYETVIAGLARLRSEWGCESNAEVIVRLVIEATPAEPVDDEPTTIDE